MPDISNSQFLVAELICVKCHHRWIGVWDRDVLLKEIKCPKCNEEGFVIQTGQIIDENTCNNCIMYKHGKCKLKLMHNKYDAESCDYFEKIKDQRE